jgi:RNA polymerase sigma-70 factor (ECF subfamily)
MSQGPDEEITRLALAAKAGDQTAAAAFIRATQRDLLRFLGLLADARDVEDLGQETYLRAMRGLSRFDARSTARSWLFAIARNVAADHVRRAQRRPRTSLLEAFNETARHHAGPAMDEAVAVRDLLTALEPARREAFTLTQVLGLSYEEAAEICSCPVGTIRSRVSRAREDLVAAMRTPRQVTGSSTVEPFEGGLRHRSPRRPNRAG